VGFMDCYEMNKRQFVRFNLNSSCKLTISEINNEKAKKMESVNTVVRNIGLGGLQIESELWFPVQDNMILKFDDTIFGILYGFILWRNEETAGIKYGVKFTCTNVKMFQIIHKLQKLTLAP
jgi:hypothetical protein